MSIRIIAAIAAAFVWAGAGLAQERPNAPASEPLKVMATFSILGDLVRNVGGDRVAVTMLVGPNADAHVYNPAPADARKMSEAKLVVANGLGFEGWINRLVRASGTKAPLAVATKGVKPRKMSSQGHSHDHGSDPHAWQSVANVKIYVANIRDSLSAVDPAGKAAYEANAAAYAGRLDELDREVRDAIARLPQDRRRIITTHDAFGYFADAYGIEFIAPHGVSTEAQAAAKDVARIIAQVRRQKIPAVFLENVSDPRLMKRIADETGAKIGGTLYSDALTDASGPAPTYIELIRHNVRTLGAALSAP